MYLRQMDGNPVEDAAGNKMYSPNDAMIYDKVSYQKANGEDGKCNVSWYIEDERGNDYLLCLDPDFEGGFLDDITATEDIASMLRAQDAMLDECGSMYAWESVLILRVGNPNVICTGEEAERIQEIHTDLVEEYFGDDEPVSESYFDEFMQFAYLEVEDGSKTKDNMSKAWRILNYIIYMPLKTSDDSSVQYSQEDLLKKTCEGNILLPAHEGERLCAWNEAKIIRERETLGGNEYVAITEEENDAVVSAYIHGIDYCAHHADDFKYAQQATAEAVKAFRISILRYTPS